MAFFFRTTPLFVLFLGCYQEQSCFSLLFLFSNHRVVFFVFKILSEFFQKKKGSGGQLVPGKPRRRPHRPAFFSKKPKKEDPAALQPEISPGEKALPKLPEALARRSPESPESPADLSGVPGVPGKSSSSRFLFSVFYFSRKKKVSGPGPLRGKAPGGLSGLRFQARKLKKVVWSR